MTDSDEDIFISQKEESHWHEELRLRSQVRIKLFHIILQ